jgi:hypothetical protein
VFPRKTKIREAPGRCLDQRRSVFRPSQAPRHERREGAHPSRDHEQVWGPTVDVQYLRIYVRQLRHKIQEQPRPRHILTEAGVGYRLTA